MSTVLVLLCVLIVMVAGMTGVVWSGFRGQKRNAEKGWEYRQELAQTQHAWHLETMKAHKGDSYVGRFAGMDVHTDDAIPDMFMYATPATPSPPVDIKLVEDWHGKITGGT